MEAASSKTKTGKPSGASLTYSISREEMCIGKMARWWVHACLNPFFNTQTCTFFLLLTCVVLHTFQGDVHQNQNFSIRVPRLRVGLAYGAVSSPGLEYWHEGWRSGSIWLPA
jgi:hypothetical protein